MHEASAYLLPSLRWLATYVSSAIWILRQDEKQDEFPGSKPDDSRFRNARTEHASGKCSEAVEGFLTAIVRIRLFVFEKRHRTA